jgi:hypothetical protein
LPDVALEGAGERARIAAFRRNDPQFFFGELPRRIARRQIREHLAFGRPLHRHLGSIVLRDGLQLAAGGIDDGDFGVILAVARVLATEGHRDLRAIGRDAEGVNQQLVVTGDLPLDLVRDSDPPQLGELRSFLAVCRFVDEDRIVSGLFAGFLRVALGALGGENDRLAVLGPFERLDRALVIGELGGFAAVSRDHIDLCRGIATGAAAAGVGVAAAARVARGQKRDRLAIRRPRRIAIFFVAEKAARVRSVRVRDPDRGDAFVVLPLAELGQRVEHAAAVGRDPRRRHLRQIQHIVDGHGPLRLSADAD